MLVLHTASFPWQQWPGTRGQAATIPSLTRSPMYGVQPDETGHKTTLAQHIVAEAQKMGGARRSTSTWSTPWT
jgi:hypothetical protein